MNNTKDIDLFYDSDDTFTNESDDTDETLTNESDDTFSDFD